MYTEEQLKDNKSIYIFSVHCSVRSNTDLFFFYLCEDNKMNAPQQKRHWKIENIR
jgi:hypothetical protein